MPAKVIRRDGKFRVVHGTKRHVVKNKGGGSVDGGGHKTKQQAIKRAINRKG